ncbi:fimbrillin family protein [Prevotella sp. E2-28]|uniref:fimbrillin family protein n=1 Tax=Prevotella sp. E2-28 TaxID=2913620 RepID=UPI001EDBA3C6|nr:fimbrillin family protein [Prevotella sp. E2-28]UKK54653.1 fimbrillin family protein [Prevotella sp. E2-28]
MKKSLFLMAAASALMLTACTNEDATNESVVSNGKMAVGFDTYVPNATRAGDAGIQTTATLQTNDKGFGVFAQYSNDNGSADGAYSKAATPVANFMWNEHVSYNASAWTYSPLKYWPNETSQDSQDPKATSDHADKLSFFAYAPYVAEASGIYTGKLTGPTYSDDPAIDDSKITANGGGIEAVIANNATGNDPWVRYAVATDPSKSVDLLWGVAPSGGLSYTDVSGGTTSVLAGMPLVDLLKPSKDQKIKFLFQHALARIGLTVIYAADQIAAGGQLNNQTKIAVKSVNVTEVTATKQLKTSGALNLKNTDAFQALWTNTAGDINLSVGVGSGLNPNIAYKDNASDTWNQTGTWTGVENIEHPVIADNNYFMVIPGNANTDLQVTITYDVITKDAKVATGYSEVENVIKKTVTIPTLSNNKAYTLKLILGMTSVKLDAEVADWEIMGSTDVNLPKNEQ